MADESNTLKQLRILSAEELTAYGSRLQGQPSLAQVLAQNEYESERNTPLDTAVGILDTLQTLSTTALAPLPGVGLKDIGRMSGELDQFRSPAYLAERATDAQRVAEVSAAEGEWAGLVEGAKTTLQGGNLTADVVAQSPYLALGPVARAMGASAAMAVPGVMGRVVGGVAGTSEGAIINRVAALSGTIEGASAYSQTYERAIADGATEEEATQQARVSGVTSAIAGFGLGKLTPGFELDPTGLRRTGIVSQFLGDAIKPTLSAVGGEVVEESGMAITNTVTDNILAGKDPMEGVGGQVGQAAVISSVFTGGIRAPGLVRDTSKAIGAGVMKGLSAIGGAAANRAVTPDAAAVDAALASVNEEVIPSTEGSSGEPAPTNADGLSDAERGIKAIQDAVKDITPTQAPTVEDTKVEEPPVQDEAPPPSEDYQLSTDEPIDPTNVEDEAVKAVLTSAKIDSIGEAPIDDGVVTAEQAEAIQTSGSLETAGRIEEARQTIADKTDADIQEAAQNASQSPADAALIEAVAAVDITRVPDSAVPDVLKPVVDNLKAAVDGIKARMKTRKERSPGIQKTAEQMLSTGWNTTNKANRRKKGMQEHIQNVVNGLRTLRPEQRSGAVDLSVATEAARFMKQIAARAAAFKKVEPILAVVNNWFDENKAKYPEYKKYVDQGFIDVEGTETLDEDGLPSGKPFRITLSSKSSQSIVEVVQEDFADAMSMYNAVKSVYPKLMEAAEARADKAKEAKDKRQTLRELQESNKPKAKPAAEQKKAEPAPKPAEDTAAKTTRERISRSLVAAKTPEQIDAVEVDLNKDGALLDPKDQAALRTALERKRTRVAPPPPPAATAAPAPTASESAPGPVVVSANVIVTDERAEVLRNKFKPNKLNSGFDPELMAASVELAIYHIERGARTFAAYSQAMLADAGEGIRDYLKAAYKAAKFDKRLPKAVRDEMDSVSAVNKAETEVAPAPVVEETQSEDPGFDEDAAQYGANENSQDDDLADLAFQDMQDMAPGVAAIGEDAVQVPTINPLTQLTNWAKVGGKTLFDWFNVRKDVSYAGWVQKLKDAGVYSLYEAEAESLFNHFYGLGKEYSVEGRTDVPIGIFQRGEAKVLGLKDIDKPHGAVSVFMVEENGVLRVPEEVGRAFALAGAIVVLRNAAIYNTPFNERGEPIRAAIPGVWAKDITELALKMLGVKATRQYSLSIEQGAPLQLGLSTVEALVRSQNFQTKVPGVHTYENIPTAFFQEADSDGVMWESKVLIPTDIAHKAGITNLEGIDHTGKLFETARVWEASDTPTEDISTVDKVIQYTRTALSTKLRQGLFKREQVSHGLNTQLNDVTTVLGDDNLAAVMMGHYGEIPKTKDGRFPPSVIQTLRSLHTAYMYEFEAARKYAAITENGLKKLYYKYHLGINNRAKTAMGPQNNKFLRDLFSSAQETLDLNNPDHVKFLKLAMAQALGVKTDINDHDTVIQKWDTEVAAEYREKALEIQDALTETDQLKRQGKLLTALRRNTPWTPRELSAMLTYGKMLRTLEGPAQPDGSIPFENFLPFEIDGKTNGAFNTELFFGLGVRNGANLEQGGLFLSKVGATFEKERERMLKEYKSDDFYGRINQSAEVTYALELVNGLKARQRKNPNISADWWWNKIVGPQLGLLEAAGLIEFDADPKKAFSIVTSTGEVVNIPQIRQFKFKRDAGKIASIPVQYGASARGVKSQLWREMVSILNHKWIQVHNELERTSEGPARDKLNEQRIAIELHLQGSDSFRKMDKSGQLANDATNDDKRWHYGVMGLAEALRGAYRGEKPRVAMVTDALVELTNLAYIVKAAKWKVLVQKLKLDEPQNKALREKYGEKVWLYEPSLQDFGHVNDGTLDISFSTANGNRSISLNNTDYDPNGTKMSGFGTSFETRLDVPNPKKVRVRILALLTIGGGDSAMGTDFFQGDWNATDVYDGIELLVSQIMEAGTALNESVWRTGEFDILKDFFRLNEGITQFLQQATQEERDAAMEIWKDLQPRLFAETTDENKLPPTFTNLRTRFEEAESNFQWLYGEQRKGWDRLVAEGPHTMSQMGGGGTFTTPNPTERAAALELELEEDIARLDAVDLSQVGTREAGLYPNQFRDPRATRIEDSEGLIDVIMNGLRWVGKNTWNSPNAKFDEKTNLSAGTRRLLNVLRLAAKAGATYDSDKSVHPSAIKMYLRAKADGVLTWESDFTMAQLEAAIANNTVLRTDNSPSPDGKPVFRNVRLVGREARWVGYNDTDTDLKTAFNVGRLNTLDRAGIIAAMDKVQWKNPIHRAVWSRLRKLLNPDVRITLTSDLEAWNTWADAVGSSRRFGSVGGLSVQQRIAVLHASPSLILHELLHSVFTNHFNNFFSNINAVPANLREPINDLVQLTKKVMNLTPKGNTAFLQQIMRNHELEGDSAAVLDEMLAYVLTSEQIIEQQSPGIVKRVVLRLKQILARILGITIETPFYDEVLDVFRGLTDNFESTKVSLGVEPRAAAAGLSDLEQMTEQAYRELRKRVFQRTDIDMRKVKREWPRVLGMAQSAYNLTIPQQQMFTRVYTLMRTGQRSADVEEFINTTLAKHPQKNLFLNAPDMVAAAMALVAVEPTFANQLNALWPGRPTQSRLQSVVNKALDIGQADASQQILNEALASMVVSKDAYDSYLGTAVSRLDRVGRGVLEALGEKVEAFNDALPANTPDAVDLVLRGIAALASEKSAKKYGQTLMTAVNTLSGQQWLKALVADLQGTKGDGKLFYRAHNAMMNAINRTRSQFDNALPRELAKLFPDDFQGWNTLFESFGTVGAHVLGSSAREMYLNDAERKRMINVLQSRVNNWIDAQNLGYYLVHRDIRPGSAQELLRNARAIADNVNGDRQTASEELVADADQLVTLYAIDFLEASERAKVGKYFRDHPAAMESLTGMMKSVKEAEEATYSNQYKYLYWKDSLPMSTDPRSSVIIANAVDGARAVQLGYTKGEQYRKSAGDPETLHYYTRNFSPPPVFSQGVIATVQQTGMGINYTTAATISPLVGTMITDKRVIAYIQRNRALNSNLIPIHSFDGELIGYERMLDRKIVRKTVKGDNTLLHVAIGKRLGRIAEENIAKMVNEAAVQGMVEQWKDGQAAGRQDEYTAVDSSTDKQVARAWEVVPADMKETLQKAFNGPVMIRNDLLHNTIGYHNQSALEIFTGDASIDPNTRKMIIGLVQTVFFGQKGMQYFLAAEQAWKEGVATAKDTIIVRSLSVPYNNFLASVHLVVANGVPITKVFKWYREGMKEIQQFNRLERERVQLTIQIAGTENQAEKVRLQAVQNSKVAAIQRLSIYPLIAAGDLSDLPEGLDDTPSHTYLGDLAGWVNNHLKEKVHPKAPRYLANAIFAKDSTLHDVMSKAIQAGDFLARYAIYQHNLETGVLQEDAIDIVRDELVSYQTNPGRMRGGLEAYGMIWWSQFTIRAQNVILNRFRRNPFSFFVSQGLAGLLGTPGPMDGFITERGLDNSIGVDNVFTAPTAYLYAKAF